MIEDLVQSAREARERGDSLGEWMAYEAMLPNPHFGVAGPHVAALVWTGFFDDCDEDE